MSKALDYLVEARPEAMGHYFQFLKESGRNLDTRTRDLISVITKVAVQTEGGFRHYLRRALRNGATADEVLDALLMAFPVLGLAKVVWATEILLEMDLSEFAAGTDTEEAPPWTEVAALESLPLESAVCLERSPRPLYLYRDAEGVRAYDSRCPHQQSAIPCRGLEGNRLTCPAHQWVFDLTTGDCVARGDEPLPGLETKVESGRVWVRLPA